MKGKSVKEEHKYVIALVTLAILEHAQQIDDPHVLYYTLRSLSYLYVRRIYFSIFVCVDFWCIFNFARFNFGFNVVALSLDRHALVSLLFFLLSARAA